MQLVLVPTGMTIDVKKPDLVMGRHSTTDICLPLADVSRRHCRLLWLEGHWHIIDLGSLNGTMVNDRRIDQAILKHGDHVRVGSFVLEVRFPDATTMTEPLRPTRKAS
jgi:pSer/pThr/pTyr-binding forkhead associated (FHA) protein